MNILFTKISCSSSHDTLVGLGHAHIMVAAAIMAIPEAARALAPDKQVKLVAGYQVQAVVLASALGCSRIQSVALLSPVPLRLQNKTFGVAVADV